MISKRTLLPLIMLFIAGTAMAGVKVGDTLTFWSVSYIDWLKTDFPPQKQIKAACRYVAPKCYVFTDVLFKDSINQIKAEMFGSTLSSDYYKLTDLYGPVPDALDNDPRIYILGSANEWWGGYFDPTHQMPDTMTMRLWGMHSSEKEIIFLNGKLINTGDASAVAHEFGHMLHWGQDHSPEPILSPVKYWEDTWIDEGFSTFAEIWLTENINQKDVQFLRPFFSTNYGVPLIYFENYSASRLCMLYMYEHYGKEKYIKNLISNQLNGIDGIESTLNDLGYNISFDKAFHDFTLANLLDRTTAGGDQYYYSHYNFPSVKYGVLTQSAPMTADGVLKAFATYYYRIVPSDTNDYIIQLDATNDKTTLSLVSLRSGADPEVTDMFIDASGKGTMHTSRFKAPSDTIILVVSNISRSLEEGKTESYKLTVSAVPLSVADELPDIGVYADSRNSLLILSGANMSNSQLSLELFDYMGRPIPFTEIESGRYRIDNGFKGFIFARIKSGSGYILKKVMF